MIKFARSKISNTSKVVKFLILFFLPLLVGCDIKPLTGQFGLSSSATGFPLKIECQTTVPESFPYSCQTVGGSTNGSTIYTLSSSTCPNLSIDTSGKVFGSINLKNSENCSFKVTATTGGLVEESDTIDLNIGSPIEVSYSDPKLFIQKGGTSQRVYLQLSEPSPFDVEIDYGLFGFGSKNDISGFSETGKLSLTTGVASYPLDFEVLGSASLADVSYLKLRLSNVTSNSVDDLELNLYVNPIPQFTTAGLGNWHSCAISTGNLYCWGIDEYGQVGDGVGSSIIPSPLLVDPSGNWSFVDGGTSTTCGIQSGNLYCWGRDTNGQVGNGVGSSANVLTPELIDASGNWQHLSLGDSHSCGIDNGNLYCWGLDDFGQVGNGVGSSADVTSPAAIDTSGTWTMVAGGLHHSCGIDNGVLKCWGRDNYGQIGNGSGSAADVTAPEIIDASGTWTFIVTGDNHSCGIDNGALKCWGYDAFGQVGDDALTLNRTSPLTVGSSINWTYLAAGEDFSCGIDGGALKCWGRNDWRQLGVGSSVTIEATTPLTLGSSTNWSYVSAGLYHACGNDNGNLKCWGGDYYGQTGVGNLTDPNQTLPLSIGLSSNWTAVESGEHHSCALEGLILKCWGYDYYGQVGNDDFPSQLVSAPTPVNDNGTWTKFSAGVANSCAIDDGNLKCWGRSIFGQPEYSSPNLLDSSGTWTNVSVGRWVHCGIDIGNLKCWGIESYGELGNGSVANDSTATPITIDSSGTWTDVSAGREHICGIDNGNLYCWGRDASGQIGNGVGSSANVLTPELIDSSGTWTSVDSGLNHSCGLDAGVLKCWGDNTYGQVGNGTNGSTVTAPEIIDNTGTWSSLSMGHYHSCAIDAGAVKCWGANYYGQIGNGTFSSTSVNSPTQVGSDTNWNQVSAGGYHSCGIKNGDLQCWGGDNLGQLGMSFDISAPYMLVDF